MASRLPPDSRPSTVLGVVHQLRTAAASSHSAPSPARAPSPLCAAGGGGRAGAVSSHALRDAFTEIDRLDSLLSAADERAAFAAAGRTRVGGEEIHALTSPRLTSQSTFLRARVLDSSVPPSVDSCVSPLLPSRTNAFIPSAAHAERLRAIDATLAKVVAPQRFDACAQGARGPPSKDSSPPDIDDDLI